MDENEFVNVSIRIKPAKTERFCIKLINQEPPILLVTDRSQTFTFDQVFDQHTCQETVFDQTVKPLVNHVKNGYNCTVFGYGQTGTGKTYTIGTESEVIEEDNLGLIPRALRQFFQYDTNDNFETEIYISFTEIYNERVFDLLQNNSNPLVMKGMKLQGFCKERVYNIIEAQHFLKIGNKNRHTAGTKQNSKSSRSHAIFTIYYNTKNSETEKRSKLNLVDLAGCESVKKTGSQGSTFHEGININKGLLSISQVIIALSTNASFIPYRQSIITTVLQDSLNKRNYISLIACVSSMEEDTTETLQTLDFAHRLKKIRSRPELNEIVAQFKRENPNPFPVKRIGVTPFKRPAPSHLQTPYLNKRLKRIEITKDINTDQCEEQTKTPKSLLSFSGMSTVSGANTDITQHALSPVIKKYVSAMEASLMDKLKVLIKTNSKGTSDEIEVQRQEEKENDCTLQLNWCQLHNKSSKLAKSATSEIKIKSIQVTSSLLNFENFNEVTSTPKGSEDLDKIKGKLVYESPNGSQQYHSMNYEKNSYQKPIFKVPELPMNDNKTKKNESFMSVSAIENVCMVPRRSLRLSLRKLNISDKNNSDCTQLITNEVANFNNKTLDLKKKRSIRLFNKVNTANIVEKCCAITKTAKVTRNNYKSQNSKLNIANTPFGKRMMKTTRKDSPHTTHTKEVLNILQTGSVKDLEKLQLIGTKSAHQIVLSRLIKGNFKGISDLLQMPGWGNKKFEKFVDQNFLKKELL